MKEQIFKSLQDHSRVLLIIDNLESCLQNDKIKLRNFLKSLFERLLFVKILATSRQVISDIGEVTEKVCELKHLSNACTV